MSSRSYRRLTRYAAFAALHLALDEVERSRWRIALWLLPWSMVLYWHVHVRDRRPDVAP